MLYEHLTEFCHAAEIGEGGLSAEALQRGLEEATRARERLRRRYADGSLPLLALPDRSDDLAAIEAHAARYRARFERVLVCGIGGSSLGGRTLCALAKAGPRVEFVEGLDPHSFEDLLAGLVPEKTGLLVISKSGGTAEALTQFAVLRPHFELALGRAGLKQAVTVITEAADSPLKRMAETDDLPCLDHDPGIGGRYTALTNVGLLPAMIAGLDGAAVRRGAAQVLHQTLQAENVAEAPPALGAALGIGLLRERRISQSVLFSYLDRLADFGLWYRQLWAESLGKDGTGTTPIPAQGPVDQHSQLQLYLAGPHDKFFTLVDLDIQGQGATIPADALADPSLAYLANRRLGDVVAAMAQATGDALARNGHPVRRLRLQRFDEEVLGGLMMHFMLETILAAELLGVNAFDQPAVEEGKVLARQILSGGGS